MMKMLFRIYSSISYHLWRNLFKIALILFFRLKIRGRENLPKKGNFILASNHVSYMDPAIVGSGVRRRVYFVASDHLYKKKLTALWFSAVGCIKIQRGEPNHRAMRKILDYLKEHKPVAIFPEGSRSPDGSIQDPLAGVGFLAMKAHVPVVPCFVKGSDKALPRGAKFFKFAAVTLYIGKPIMMEDFASLGDKKEKYRLFSKSVMEEIARLGRVNEGTSTRNATPIGVV